MTGSFYLKPDPMIKNYDLEPEKDPKGGSPKTPPGGIRKAAIPTPYPPYMTVDVEPKKIGFFHLQFRDVIYTISIVAAALVFYFQKQSDVHDLTVKVALDDKVRDQMSETIKAQQKLIDANSTGLQLQSAGNIERDKRISEMQTQLILLVPGMVEIKTKLNFVAELMDHQSKEHR